MNVGIAHIAATVNTLVFAYLGAALPLLVVLAIQVESFSLTVNEEIIAVEVVRTLVGSIGILLAVPATTAIAAWLAPSRVTPPAARRRARHLSTHEGPRLPAAHEVARTPAPDQGPPAPVAGEAQPVPVSGEDSPQPAD